MKKKTLFRSLFLLLLMLGCFCCMNNHAAYADAIPAKATTDAGYQPVIDPNGCASDAHSFTHDDLTSYYCDQMHYDKYECNYCNTCYYVKVAAKKCDYYYSSTNLTSCTKGGQKIYFCYNCNQKKTVKIAATDHKYVLQYKDYNYCTDRGYNYYTCSVCYKDKTTSHTPVAHKYVTTYEKASATNRTYGYKTKKCKVCSSSEWSSFSYPSEIKLSYSKTTYSGKRKKPTVKVYDGDGKRIYSSNYDVTYDNNLKPGKAKVTVKFKGKKYSGTLKEYFLIVPKKVASVSASYQSSAKLKVKWSGSTGASGYVVYYSTSSSFAENGRTCKRLYSSDKRSAVIPYMAQTTYYVKVRPYKTVDGTKYLGSSSDKKKVTIRSGSSMTTMLSHLKSTTANRKQILSLTNNQVDVSKYGSTLARIKAIYSWHAKNSSKFVHCMACNMNFNDCIYYLINDKQYDKWIRLGCDRYRNNSGSVVQHKWSVLFLQGVPYIFDPRMQGNLHQPGGFSHFGVTYGSSVGKHYLLDGYMF